MSRTILNFNDGFSFAKGRQPGAESLNFSGTEWQPVTIPHDFSISGPFDREAETGAVGGYRPAGFGWYRKRFTVPDSYRNKRVELEFGGIYRNPTIFLNGKKIAEWANGYVTRRVDLSPYLEYGMENILTVFINNHTQPASRYYTGCGIYRNVRLILRDQLYIRNLHPFITTPEVSKEHATVSVCTTLENQFETDRTVTLQYLIKNQEGIVVANFATKPITVPARGEASAEHSIFLQAPALWSPDSPALYALETEVLYKGKLLDCDISRFGVRSIQFDAEEGFFLNGERTYMKGVCLHHDNSALGAAENPQADRRRLLLMKEMGANAIRLSHNPFAESFLDLCDELGFLVMDEFFDEWKHPQNIVTKITDTGVYERTPGDVYHAYFDENWEEDLVGTIIRDRNHPSVVMYSIGNEIIEQRQMLSGVVETSAMLANKTKEYDSTRPVTCACCFDQREKTPPMCDTLDVVGYNYADALFAEHHERFPNRLIIGSETVTISPFWKRGFYDLEVLGEMNRYVERKVGECFDQRAVRICSAETSMRNHMNPKYISGVFLWTGIDYLGEPTPHTWPSRSAYFGAADTCCFPKDGFYYYQSIWSNRPVLHIMPHWNLDLPRGTPVDVIAYTNCDKVELFLNGESMGFAAQRRDRYEHMHWQVPYEPGTLLAVGYDGDGRQTVTDRVVTAGPPKLIQLSVDRQIMTANGTDTAFVTATLTDCEGNIVPVQSHEIEFLVEEGLELVGVDNGDPEYIGDLTANRIPTLAGKAMAIIRTNRLVGNYQVVARIAGLYTASLFITVLPEELL